MKSCLLLLVPLILFFACEEKLEKIYGCTDKDANNFNPDATIFDNSCEYILPFDCSGEYGGNNICGCTNTVAINYDSLATYDDGSCIHTLFNILVVDTLGNPVPDLEISVWNKLWFPYNQTRAITSIQYSITQDAIVSMKVYDLNDSLVRVLVDSNQTAGFRSVQWDARDNDGNPAHIGGSNVFRCTFTAQSNNFYFEDSCFMWLVIPYPHDDNVIGITDIDGKYVTNNKLIFPHLFDIPTMDRMGETQLDYLGEITINDTVIITLKDYDGRVCQYAKLMDGEYNNTYELLWLPNDDYNSVNAILPSDIDFEQEIIGKIPAHPDSTSMGHNFPNPFN